MISVKAPGPLPCEGTSSNTPALGWKDRALSADAPTAELVTAPAPEQNAPFYRLGGTPTITAIVERFYDLMEGDPAYAELRAMHAPDLSAMRKSLAGFLTGWAGGPRDWFEANPGKCMMSAHKPFTITAAVAGQWSEAMQRAIADAAPEVADPQLAKAMGGVLEQMARGMARP